MRKLIVWAFMYSLELSPATRMTATISSTVGGSAG